MLSSKNTRIVLCSSCRSPYEIPICTLSLLNGVHHVAVLLMRFEDLLLVG